MDMTPGNRRKTCTFHSRGFRDSGKSHIGCTFSGPYPYRLLVGDEVLSGRMMLVK